MAREVDPETQRIRVAIEAAVEDVDSIGLAGADRAVSLGAVLVARLGLPGPSSVVGTIQGLQIPDEQKRVSNPGDGLVARICSTLKIERDVADLIYDEQGGELNYVISARRLGNGKAEATRQLAQIVVAGRQAAGLEEWTPSSAIREVVNNYGKFDSANFASHLGSLDRDSAVLFRGKGAARELKVTRSGIESMADTLTALVSGS
jgi:hypothetical protein